MIDEEPYISVCFAKSELINLRDALDASIEHAKECLQCHDSSLGRTTRKNKLWAEMIEQDIVKIELAIQSIGKIFKNLNIKND